MYLSNAGHGLPRCSEHSEPAHARSSFPRHGAPKNSRLHRDWDTSRLRRRAGTWARADAAGKTHRGFQQAGVKGRDQPPSAAPLVEHLSLILSRLTFSPEQRNRINYSFEYLSGGFNELDWFDSGPDQMLNHFMPRPRMDEDITDIDRFFEGVNPADADEGNFYGDEAQILWCSLIGYLQFVKSLGFSQSFLKTETILALCDLHIGAEYPNITQGIARSVHAVLQDDFDLQAFLEHYQSSPNPEPLTSRWRLRRGEIFPKSRSN
jgi:hypothetical protein